MNSKLWEITTADRVLGVRVKLQRRSPFFAYILMNMHVTEVEEDSFIDTLGVNETGDLYYNKKYVDSLTAEQLLGVMCHEAMHIATLTFQREGKRDRFLWNIATDYIINHLIMKEGFELPKTVCLPDDKGDIVIKPPPGVKGKEIRVKLNDDTFAEELYDELQRYRDQLVKYFGGQMVSITCPEGTRSEIRFPGQMDWHLPKDQDSLGQGQDKLNTSADVRANAQLWKGRAVEATIQAKARGCLSSTMERHVGELLEPKIDWRKKLLEFVSRDLPVNYTMRTPGRRTIATGFYCPTVLRESMEVTVAIDVSASITKEEYRQFLSEVLGIAQTYAQVKMKIIFWSTYVDPADDIDMFDVDEDTLLTHVVKNSGGTTITCVKKYCEEKDYNPPMVIFLTDGAIEATPVFLENCRNLFVLSAGGCEKIVEKHGEVCKLSDTEQ